MPRQSLDERVLQLERTLGAIQHEIIGARQQFPKFDNRPQVRLAKVANTPAPGDNTFQIVFLDGSYPKASGNQTPTYLDRQLTTKEVAFNLTGVSLSQGDKVFVVFSSGYWWMYIPEGGTPPPAPPSNVTFVTIDQTTGGAANGDLQPYNASCVWPGFKTVIATTSSFCNLQSNYSEGSPIWIASTEGIVGLRQLELSDRHLGFLIATSFTVGSDTRELWGIRPHFDHPMEWLYVIESGGSSYSEPTGCKYVAYAAKDAGNTTELKMFAKQRRTGSGANACSFPVGVTEVFAVEINNRSFVRNGWYLGYRIYDAFTIAGVTKPFYYFSAGQLLQTGRFIQNSPGTVSGTTGITVLWESTSPSDGQLHDVTADATTGEITITHSGVYRVDSTVLVGPEAGSWAGLRLDIQLEQPGGGWLGIGTGYAPSFHLSTANVSTSCYASANITAPAVIRVQLSETTGNRSVHPSVCTCMISGRYE